MTNSYKFLFSSVLGASTMMILSSSSWFLSWFSLELNLLSFIPLMKESDNVLSSESSMKYFLVQSLGSVILMTGIVTEFASMSSLWSVGESLIEVLFWGSLGLSLGVAPFHLWFPELVEGLSWVCAAVILTWQKLGPFVLMTKLKSHFNEIELMVIASVMVGGVGGLNQVSLRKILAYSSISHMGWMVSTILVGEVMWLVYFLVYAFTNIAVVLMFMGGGAYVASHLGLSWMEDGEFKMYGFLGLLSLGGLPPFLGFFPKLVVIQNLMNLGLVSVPVFMVVFTLVSLYYYLRLAFNSFFLSATPVGLKLNLTGSGTALNAGFSLMVGVFSMGALWVCLFV
uniref:NADH dehydrogenase subunit 2 n=1 Tax=Apachyus feae TaxID=2914707 RepID=UPI001EFA0292|nr:NADH dehydrogenase subunit 2 [Apachyus feae]UKE80561.1 NADH dehydrogenase subunit 2 [Apachyus feae]